MLISLGIVSYYSFLCGIPGVDQHHQLHKELIEDLNQHAEKLENGLKTIEEFLEFITDWFLVHTQHEDRKLFNPA